MEKLNRQWLWLLTGRILIVSVLALSFPIFHHASSAYSAQHNRITSIHPSCADPGDRVTIRGFGFGGHNLIVTVGGIRAQVIQATGHWATFLVPASAPHGPTTVAIRHRKGSQLGSIAFQVGCGGNRPPAANAGPDQEVTVGQTVTLDGRNSSDPDGDLITYLWTITSAPAGSAAALSDPSSVMPLMVPDQPGLYEIALVVSDGTAVSAPDTVRVVASLPNTSPTAHAGPDQSVVTGSLVALDGRKSSDPDGDPLTYQWALQSLPAGSTAALNEPSSATPTFVADVSGRYHIALTVHDGTVSSAPDDVIVISATPNAPPVANAGADHSVARNSLIQLDGSQSSDPNGDPLSYSWSIVSKPAGSVSPFINADTATPTLLADLGGEYVFRLVVSDGQLESAPDTVVVTVLNGAPLANAGPDQAVTTGTPVTLDGSGSADPNGDPLTYSWALVSIPVGSVAVLSNPTSAHPSFTPDLPGTYTVSLTASDGQATSSPDTVAVNVSVPSVVVPDVVRMPQADAQAAIAAAGLAVGAITTGSSDTVPAGSVISQDPAAGISVPPGSSVSLLVSLGPALTAVPNVVTLTRASAEAAIAAAGLTVGAITSANSDTVPADSVISQSPVAGTLVSPGSAVSFMVSLGPSGGGLPPDPSTVAPPIDPTVATTVGRSTEFLYTGSNPIQTGVAPGTIEPKRAAVIRGKVLDRNGVALPAVQISVKDHPEFGQTLSRADGMFDLAVNGGGLLTVSYAKDGYLPAQRQINVPWQDYAVAPDVVMIVLDSQVSTITAGAGVVQVHQAAPVTDSDGTRRAVLLFPAGVTSQMTLPDGTTLPLSSLSVRATEYTIGPNGPRAMPGELPPTSGYTYAVELSVDEAMAAGAASVTFSEPVANYVDNFLSFPTGTIVPSGYYDRGKGQWVPMPNGRVIRIVSITNGLADLDVTGDGVADAGAELNALGVTDPEREKLAELYASDTSLWRVPVSHFSARDHNWPTNPPPLPPGRDPRSGEDDDEQCEVSGSIIACPSQVLGENVGVVGTPYQLVYRSDRLSGRAATRTAIIPLLDETVPTGLIGIELQLRIAGRVLNETFPPNPNQQFSFTWDGLDAYGRAVSGAQPLTSSINYVFDVDYVVAAQTGAAFGQPGGAVLPSNGVRRQASLGREFTTFLGTVSLSETIGGWSLDVHHAYDSTAKRLRRGDGRRVNTMALGAVMMTFAGNGVVADNFGEGDGRPALDASFVHTNGVAVAPDGTVYVSDSQRVRRIRTDGIINTFAGGPLGSCLATPNNCGDGGPATLAKLDMPQGLALGPDGSLYITERSRVRRVWPDGTITTVAGTSVLGFNGDGIPATQALLGQPRGIAVAPDGTVYIADTYQNRIRRVGLDGIITTVAGTGIRTYNGDGIPAVEANLFAPYDVAVGPKGAIYISEQGRIRRVGVDGMTATVAGTGLTGFNGDGIPATTAQVWASAGLTVGPDGRVYIADRANYRIRRIETDGTITTVAGTGTNGPYSGEGIPATQGHLQSAWDVALGPDGALYVVDDNQMRVRRIAPSLPGFNGNEIGIASDLGSEFYVFDAFGRHLRTLNSLTGAVLREFIYDSAGRLASIIEKTGGTDNVTTIARDGTGNPIQIVAPFGQETALTTNAEGYLASVTNAAAESLQMTYGASGLLETFTDARGGISRYGYDGLGRLVQATDPAGGTQTFTRTDLTTGYRVIRTTPLGRETTYNVQQLRNSDRRLTNTKPGGEATTLLIKTDGTVAVTQPDGTVTTTVLGPDPRFGMQAPHAASVTTVSPGGLTRQTTSSLTASLANPNDPFSLTSLNRTSTVNGRTTASTYTAATRTWVIATPEGRTQTVTLDALGRMVREETAGLDPTVMVYDDRGRPATLTVGSGPNLRTNVYTYNAQGFLETLTDAVGRVAAFAYDAVGRSTSKTLPDGRVVTFSFDAGGNLSSLTPPGRPAYSFGYSERDELRQFTPPDLPGTGPTVLEYNLDRAFASIADPDDRTLTIGYDAAGRPVTRTLAAAGVITDVDTMARDASGRVVSVTAASGVNSGYTYDGSLVVEAGSSGLVAGTVTRDYDASFRLASQTVNGDQQVTFSYDHDGLMVGAGDLTIARHPQNGLPGGSSLGVVSTAVSRNALGEAVQYDVTANGTSIYSFTLERDGIGRIVRKTETLNSVTDTYEYAYDTVGQLTGVMKNGAAIETYAYDSNGNRTSATLSGSTATATYDDQDRLTRYGSATHAYRASGELLSRTEGGRTITYQYDQVGNLRSVVLPDGTAIDYLVDGNDRRVGKRVNGTLVQGFLYGDLLRPVAELDGSGHVVTRFVHAGRGTAPAYMIKGGASYRIVTDHLGSVRLVVEASTGFVAQRIDYDSFGNVVQDTNPGFQPFGFAGGIYDADTRLVRFGARDYDAATGRWTARDPMGFNGRDSNLYRYARNDPANRTDVTGLQTGPDDEGWDDPTIETPRWYTERQMAERYRREQIEAERQRNARMERDLHNAVRPTGPGRGPRGFAGRGAMICAALGALGSLAAESYADDIEAWLSEHGFSEEVESYEATQSMIEETQAAQEEINQPFAEEHPFIWGFIQAFASSPPPSAMGMF